LKKRGWTIALEKVSLFVGHGFFRERDNKPHLKLYMQNAVLLIYRMMPMTLGFG
jgi:hypothetical protein